MSGSAEGGEEDESRGGDGDFLMGAGERGEGVRAS